MARKKKKSLLEKKTVTYLTDADTSSELLLPRLAQAEMNRAQQLYNVKDLFYLLFAGILSVVTGLGYIDSARAEGRAANCRAMPDCSLDPDAPNHVDNPDGPFETLYAMSAVGTNIFLAFFYINMIARRLIFSRDQTLSNELEVHPEQISMKRRVGNSMLITAAAVPMASIALYSKGSLTLGKVIIFGASLLTNGTMQTYSVLEGVKAIVHKMQEVFWTVWGAPASRDYIEMRQHKAMIVHLESALQTVDKFFAIPADQRTEEQNRVVEAIRQLYANPNKFRDSDADFLLKLLVGTKGEKTTHWQVLREFVQAFAVAGASISGVGYLNKTAHVIPGNIVMRWSLTSPMWMFYYYLKVKMAPRGVMVMYDLLTHYFKTGRMNVSYELSHNLGKFTLGLATMSLLAIYSSASALGLQNQAMGLDPEQPDAGDFDWAQSAAPLFTWSVKIFSTLFNIVGMPTLLLGAIRFFNIMMPFQNEVAIEKKRVLRFKSAAKKLIAQLNRSGVQNSKGLVVQYYVSMKLKDELFARVDFIENLPSWLFGALNKIPADPTALELRRWVSEIEALAEASDENVIARLNSETQGLTKPADIKSALARVLLVYCQEEIENKLRAPELDVPDLLSAPSFSAHYTKLCEMVLSEFFGQAVTYDDLNADLQSAFEQIQSESKGRKFSSPDFRTSFEDKGLRIGLEREMTQAISSAVAINMDEVVSAPRGVAISHTLERMAHQNSDLYNEIVNELEELFGVPALAAGGTWLGLGCLPRETPTQRRLAMMQDGTLMSSIFTAADLSPQTYGDVLRRRESKTMESKWSRCWAATEKGFDKLQGYDGFEDDSQLRPIN